ncbi:type 4b pilus protein PilO2 [Pandoraea sp. ISTKB]|uniref:type 4b pilus protein PilO2 n=1 Tax=Pandoraea sp. ISTKB TaxID=1586708 RepID=UPI0008478AD9|nr:type 4b pilus protein PilO2 [Pandoraea sp. ISTKB]ODP35039.1 hypothetical protein A9762_11785 [Pandoraea sp. ISTKB]
MGKLLDTFRRGATARAQETRHVVDLNLEIIKVNGNAYVSGLHWKLLNSPLKFRKEAKEYAARNGWDIVAYRKSSGRIEAGFGPSKFQGYKRMYSVASALAGEMLKQHGDNWIGLFDVGGDRYLLVAVVKGMIHPATDRIFDRVEAIAEYNQIIADHGNSDDRFDDRHCIAPAKLELALHEVELEKVLLSSSLRREYRLRSLKFTITKSELRFLGIIAVGAIAAWQTFAYIDGIEAEKKRVLQEQIRKQQEDLLRAANVRAREKLLAEALKHPWATQPSAHEFVNACESLVDQFPPSVAGWLFLRATCDLKSATVTFKREIGTTQGEFARVLPTVLAALDTSGKKPQIKFEDKGDSVDIEYALLPQIVGDERLADQFEATNQFLGPLQTSESEDLKPIEGLSFKEVSAVISVPTTSSTAVASGASAESEVTPNWRHLTFSFKSKIQPKRVFDSIEIRKGLRVTSLTYTLAKGEDGAGLITWDVEGDLYVNR